MIPMSRSARTVYDIVNAQPSGAEKTITITNYSFPTVFYVPIGSKVIWRNDHEGIVHRIHSLDTVTGFQSNYLEPNSAFSFTFPYAGTYRYECSLHQKLHKMIGAIVVVPRPTVLAYAPHVRLQTSAPGSVTTINGQQGIPGENGGDLLLNAGAAGAAGDRAGVVRVGGDLEVEGLVGSMQLAPNKDEDLPSCTQSTGGTVQYQSSGSVVVCMRAGNSTAAAAVWMWRVMTSREYCPVGSSANVDSTKAGCTKCGPQHYADRMGMEACIPCPTGYMSLPNRTGCTNDFGLTDAQIATLLSCQAPTLTPCYQLSVDGGTASTFHSLCDSKGTTLTIITNTNGYTVGGYTKGTWSGNTIRYDSTAFLFTDSGSPGPLTKYRVSNPSYATYTYSAYGPRFGYTTDLYVNAGMDTGGSRDTPSYYTPITPPPTHSPSGFPTTNGPTGYPTAGYGTAFPTAYPTTAYPTAAPTMGNLGGSTTWSIVDMRVLVVSNC
jgi:plastocyanin